MGSEIKKVEYLVVDTNAFIKNVPLQEIAEKVFTCQEVVNEINDKRQLRRLAVIPYDLQIKEVFPENIKVITDFALKTGDYPSLSATDIKVMALTYQLEKELVGIEHLQNEPIIQKEVQVINKIAPPDTQPDLTGFFMPDSKGEKESKELDANDIIKLKEEFGTVEIKDDEELIPASVDDDNSSLSDSSDEGGWITPSNINIAKKQVNSALIEEKHVKVACMTTDFAMQNVLKQMNLNVAALDGRIIKQLRTFILRCYACFKTTSIMTNKFCPKCGLNTLKKVGVSLDENGKLRLHINGRKPLTGRGKKFSLPRMKGGKHPNNPILAADHPMPQNRASKLARTKVNPLDDDYIAGFSPFAVRDVNSRSAQLGIRPGDELKYWMKKNPNEARRRRKK